MVKKKKPNFDVSTHILVPKHIKISQKEKEALFKQYQITFENLPKILKSDPALEKLDVKAGDIIKILRNSKTSGESVFYRGVTNV